VCEALGYFASYWNKPYFPVTCKVASLDDRRTYDTTVRIAGSWAGTAHAFNVLAELYGWKHLVLLSDDAVSICHHGARPFSDVFGTGNNYTFTPLAFGSDPTDKQLDDILQQIRSNARGRCPLFFVNTRPVSLHFA